SGNAKAEVVGAIVRSPFIQGEPIRSDKLIKGAGSGFMSAILPSGKRALAISISTNGSASAGGFILPNDHVDVILTRRQEQTRQTQQSGALTHSSETILSNVRILAIDQTVEEKDGQRVVVGKTATLELSPRQAEALALARQLGTLSLALRSIADVNGVSAESDDMRRDEGSRDVNMVRFGVTTHTTAK
ncbi:MAG: Flp pilus assembly protein CpaB, partial [Rhizobiales bacterium]|nr:Flp pilus assembly protein CpaB [Hyphomicrobiales bacterium]